ncbi:hypothetical protein GOBAR_AA39165 [Gossypium barbadense]|uniref:Uncharacterized protein n=1 Tax=Gossypium barbadense TaxID=3634 RepID=A0A2P5VRS5_GOSBA|nr:hypothetical protein GOBAR_AA39165 [Gossypium barbadense]
MDDLVAKGHWVMLVVELLDKNRGHAANVVVAASFCLGVVSLGSNGIRGGSFMLIREDNGKTQVFDIRETTLMKAFQNMYAGNANLKATGGLYIKVLGQLAGLQNAWKQHGKLPWKRLPG